jgi:DNA-binding CsgD family transcriptional regulator
MLAHRPDVAIEWADRALAEAQRGDFPHLCVQARLERASAESMLPSADPVTSARQLLEVVSEAEDLGSWTVFVRGLNNVLEAIPVHTAEGKALLERLRVAARRSGYDFMGTSKLAIRELEIAYGEGDLAATRRALARAAEWWATDDRRATCIIGLEFDLALEEGQVAKAAELFEELTPVRCRGQLWRDLMEVRARAATRDPQAGVLFQQLSLPPGESGIGIKRDVFTLVEAALAAGVDSDLVAKKVLDEMFVAAPPTRARLEPMVLGMSSSAAGRHEQAIAFLSAELAEPDASLALHIVGGLRLYLIESLLAVGNRAEAERHVEIALRDELPRWPGWRRDRAEALGRRLAGRTVQVAGDLTTREREVAGLLAEGLTNGQLARRLFISPKTASVHVSNILMKLNMSTRTEIAAWAVRTGVAADSLQPAS